MNTLIHGDFFSHPTFARCGEFVVGAAHLVRGRGSGASRGLSRLAPLLTRLANQCPRIVIRPKLAPKSRSLLDHQGSITSIAAGELATTSTPTPPFRRAAGTSRQYSYVSSQLTLHCRRPSSAIRVSLPERSCPYLEPESSIPLHRPHNPDPRCSHPPPPQPPWLPVSSCWHALLLRLRPRLSSFERLLRTSN